MKIVTKEYKVYEFMELSAEAKEQAINKYYELEDYPFLDDDIENELEYINKYFTNVKLRYSFLYCQGDGLSFSGNFDFVKFINDKFLKLPNYKKSALAEYVYKVYSKGNAGHYAYAHKSQIDYELNGFKEHKHLQKLWESILESIENYYIDICKQLEKYGYAILEYRMNNQEFSEHCQANNYNFFENGNMANL